MKTKTLLVLLLSLIFMNAQAARFGSGGGVIIDDPDGTYTGSVRSVSPHVGPDGRVYTFSYTEVTANSLSSCQQQLNSMAANPNTYIYQPCSL